MIPHRREKVKPGLGQRRVSHKETKAQRAMGETHIRIGKGKGG